MRTITQEWNAMNRAQGKNRVLPGIEARVAFDATTESKQVVIKRCDGEYRVPGPAATEAQAYYTNDRVDAVATAKAIFGTSISITLRSVSQF